VSRSTARFARIPSVNEVLQTSSARDAIGRYGRPIVVDAVRACLGETRAALKNGGAALVEADDIAASMLAQLEAKQQANVRPVFNFTGTVLHTNLGRALLADAAVEAATIAMRDAVALEYDLDAGKRGERDALIRGLLCELTGAEDATVVNNNAAAVLLTLNTFAKGKEVIVSRGELIEIGGAFRMPEIMVRAGTKLVEVGTTNRTYEKDYIGAIGPKTGLILKVHTSNYRVTGFTREVIAKKLSEIARRNKVPLVNDLGSGTLIDLSRYGLAHEPTVAEAIAEGADLVTFSGDKLLGGPQAGFIVGRNELIARINKNPMKRALRVDKIRLAALEATLRLYRDPDRLAERLPTLRQLARKKLEIKEMARRLLPALAGAVGTRFDALVVDCASQIGSGALPEEAIPSAGIAIRPKQTKGAGHELSTLSSRFRALPVPVIGRIENQSLILDLRCLENEDAFLRNLSSLRLAEPKS
jgi:L-seryl-tRNA(Ser) seleniumtransferase